MYGGDGLILFLLCLLAAGWLYHSFRKWLTAPPKVKHIIEADDEIPMSEAVRMLEYSGYEVLTGKRKVPITIRMNDEEDELESRLFIDYFAVDGDKLYLVKLARDRKPMDMTGSSIRDHLLVYQLLYEEAEGVLYVDTKQRSIHKFTFRIKT